MPKNWEVRFSCVFVSTLIIYTTIKVKMARLWITMHVFLTTTIVSHHPPSRLIKLLRIAKRYCWRVWYHKKQAMPCPLLRFMCCEEMQILDSTWWWMTYGLTNFFSRFLENFEHNSLVVAVSLKSTGTSVHKSLPHLQRQSSDYSIVQGRHWTDCGHSVVYDHESNVFNKQY